MTLAKYFLYQGTGMHSRVKKLPLWEVLAVLLGAPALYALMFLISGVSFSTFSHYAFLAGTLTEYIFLGIALCFLRRSRDAAREYRSCNGPMATRSAARLRFGIGLFMLFAVQPLH